MVIGTSTLLAILRDEPEGHGFTERIEEAALRTVSAATLVESSNGLESRFDPSGMLSLDQLLEAVSVSVAPFDAEPAMPSPG